MDEFEKRLKDDALAIEADVSPELRKRIDASLQATSQDQPVRQERSAMTNLWWASSLTGLAAAAIVIVLMNMNRTGPEPDLVEPVAIITEPELPDFSATPPPLDIRTAEFTSPLEIELENLKSDIEKARDSVEDDIDFAF